MNIVIIICGLFIAFTGLYNLINEGYEKSKIQKAATVKSESCSIVHNRYLPDEKGKNKLYLQGYVDRYIVMENGDYYYEKHIPYINDEGHADFKQVSHFKNGKEL